MSEQLGTCDQMSNVLHTGRVLHTRRTTCLNWKPAPQPEPETCEVTKNTWSDGLWVQVWTDYVGDFPNPVPSQEEHGEIIICDGCKFSFDVTDTNSVYCLRCERMRKHLSEKAAPTFPSDSPGPWKKRRPVAKYSLSWLIEDANKYPFATVLNEQAADFIVRAVNGLGGGE